VGGGVGEGVAGGRVNRDLVGTVASSSERRGGSGAWDLVGTGKKGKFH
jgi:hypothetical protein